LYFDYGKIAVECTAANNRA